MNPNLIVSPFTHKDLLLKKLYYSVICSVLSQLVILQVYVLITHIDILHPIEWIWATLRTFSSLRAWIFILPFMLIIFAQSIICAKDYIVRPNYCSTRFQKFISVFSVHNFVILVLNILSGITLIWLLAFLGRGRYAELMKKCKGGRYCLNEATFYVLASGVWTGLYYFVKVHISEKHLTFPVIHQRKLLQFKAQVLPLLRESFYVSLLPTFYFAILFYIWGDIFTDSTQSLFGLLKESSDSDVFIYVHLWIFAALYRFNMYLMRFFFNLFLTEPVDFPLCQTSENSLCLQTSITMSELPIIQNLACLDLYNLAQWSKTRRQLFFTLSQPGGHPHNWNSLVENVLKLFVTYNELLSKSTETNEIITKPAVSTVQSPFQSPDRFRNMRNMSLVSDPGAVDIVEMSHANLPMFSLPETIFAKCKQKLNSAVSVTKVVLGIDFLFGELPQANVQNVLSNGQVIIWTSQGISELVCASLVEDHFGIVQKDLATIITTLVQLKQNLDKLNKVPALTRRIVGYDNFYFKMKGAITVAVRRSLFNICINFNKYLNDLPLNKDVVAQLQTIYKS